MVENKKEFLPHLYLNNVIFLPSQIKLVLGFSSCFCPKVSDSRPKKVADIIDAFNKSRKAKDAGESGQNGKIISCKKDPISGNATTKAEVSKPPNSRLSF